MDHAHAAQGAFGFSACLLILATPIIGAQAAHAQAGFPNKPIIIVNPHPPGGTTDNEVRVHTQKLMELSNWKAVMDYRAGAGGTIGNNFTAKSAPDGHTLLAITPGFTVSPAFYTDLPYDPIKDFTPVIMMTRRPVLLMTYPALPVKSVK